MKALIISLTKDGSLFITNAFTIAFSGSEPGNELSPPDSSSETDFPVPAVPAELSNDNADGDMPPKYSDVIEREHLNPGANHGQINHDHTLNGFSSNNVAVGSGIAYPVSTGDHDASKRDTSANISTDILGGVQYAPVRIPTNTAVDVQHAPVNIITISDGEMPPPPSYDDALSGLFIAAPLDAEH